MMTGGYRAGRGGTWRVASDFEVIERSGRDDTVRNMNIRDILGLVTSIAACLCAGAVGSIFMRQTIHAWYAALKKPPFNPPSWVFAPVWTLLYLLMGVAAFLVWHKGLKKRQVKMALVTFSAQLVLNVLWSVVFLGLGSSLRGLVMICALGVRVLLIASPNICAEL